MDLSPGRFDHIDHRLHDHLVELVSARGPQDLAWLARRARRDLHDARIDEQAVIDVVQVSTLLVPLPGGGIEHALRLLEGNVLTHRVRAPLRGRTDLWLGCGAQPLLNVAAITPLQLADGSGAVRRAEPGHDALVGPRGWLPDVDRYELVGLRVVDQRLRVEKISEDELPDPEQQLRVREMLSSIYLRECDYAPVDDLTKRPAMLARTISLALLEDPRLFGSPYPPLDELLHNPLERRIDLEHWRAVATWQQCETEGFWIDGMPIALRLELTSRARQYGMTDAQLIVAMLGTLAWRTPFAEDMEPWSDWVPDQPASPVTVLPQESDPPDVP